MFDIDILECLMKMKRGHTESLTIVGKIFSELIMKYHSTI